MSKDDQSWRTAPEPKLRKERLAALPPDRQRHVEDGLYTLKEAENLAKGLKANGDPR
jgi:hypothetical protein